MKNGKVGGNGGLLFSLDMESAGFMKTMSGINKAIGLLAKETKALDRIYKSTGDEVGRLEETYQSMTRQLDVMKTKQSQLNKELKDMSPDTKKYQQQAQEINKVTGQIAELEAKLKSNRHAYANLNIEGDKLRENLKATNGVLKSQQSIFEANGNLVEANRVHQQRLRNEITETNKIRQTEISKLSKIKEEFGKHSNEVKNQISKINELKLKHSELSNAYDKTADKTDYLNKRQQALDTTLGRNLKNLKDNKDRLIEMRNAFMSVGAVSTGMAYPMARAIGGSVKATVEWQNSFAEVQKTVDGMSEKGFKKLDKSIMDMSKRIPETATSLAETMALSAQLGVPNDQLIGFTEVVSQLGVATNMTSEEAAEAMSRFANITQLKLSKENFEKLGSTVVYLGAKMTASESEISNFMLRLGGVGNQVGMEQKNILALSSAMASVGISAEAGGTAMSAVMKKINTAVMDGGQGLKDFASVSGMSAEEFKAQWEKDPYVAITQFEKGLNNVKKSGGNVSETLRDLGIKESRQQDAVIRLSGGYKQLENAQDIANKGWKEGTALSKEAETRYKTLGSRIQIFKNHLFALGRSIGEAVAPVLIALMDALTPLIKALTNAPDSVKLFAVALASIPLIIAPVSFAMAGLLGLLSSVAVSLEAFSLSASAGKVPTTLLGKSVLFLNNPLKTTGKGFKSLGGSITKILKPANIFNNIGTKITKFLPNLGKRIFDVFKVVRMFAVSHPITAIIMGVITAIGILYTKVKWVKDFVNELFKAIGSLGKVVVMFGNYVWDATKKAFKGFMKLEPVQKTMEGIGKGIDIVKSGWNKMVKVLEKPFKVSFDFMTDKLKSFNKMVKDSDGNFKKFSDTFISASKKNLEEAKKHVKQAWDTSIEVSSKFFKNTGQKISSGIQSSSKGIKEWAVGLGPNIHKWLKQSDKDIRSWAQGTGEKIGGWLSTGKANFNEFTENTKTSLGNAFKEINDWKNRQGKINIDFFGRNIEKSLKELDELPEKIGKKIGNIKKSISEFFTNAFDVGSEMFKGTTKSIGDFFGKLPETFGKYKDNVNKSFTDFWDKALTKTGDGIIGFGKWWKDTKEWFSDLPKKLSETVSSIKTDVGKTLTDLFVPNENDKKKAGDNIKSLLKSGTKKATDKKAKEELRDDVGAYVVDGTIWGIEFALVVIGSTIKELVERSQDAMNTPFEESVAGAIWNAIKPIPKHLEDAWNTVKDTVSGKFNEYWKKAVEIKDDIFNPLKEKISSNWESTSNWFGKKGSSAWGGFKNGWNNTISSGQDLFTNLKNKLSEKSGTLINYMSSKGKETYATLSTGFSMAMFTGKTLWNNLTSGLSKAYNGVKRWFIQKGISLGLSLKSGWDSVVSSTRTFFTGIWNSMKTGWNKVVLTTKTTYGIIKSFLYSIWNNIWTKIKSTVSSIGKSISSGWDWIKNKTISIYNAIKNKIFTIWSNIWKNTKTIVSNIYNKVKSTWDSLKSKTYSIYEAIKNKIVSIFKNIWNSIKHYTSTISNKIKSIWDFLLRKTKEIFSAIFKKVFDTFKNMWNKIKYYVDTIKNKVTNGFTTMKKNALDMVQKMKDGAIGKFKSMYDGAKKWVDKISKYVGDMKDKVYKKGVSFGKGAGNGAIWGLNKMIDGANSISKKITGKTMMSRIPKLSTGTLGLTKDGKLKNRTKAIVNDKGVGNGKGGYTQELITRRDGSVEAPKGNNVKVTLNKGDGVVNGATTQALEKSGIVKLSTGTGDSFISKGKDLLGSVWKKIGDVWDYIENPKKLVDKVMGALSPKFGDKPSGIKDITEGAYKSLKSGLAKKISSWFESSGGGAFNPFAKWTKTPGRGWSHGGHAGIDYAMPAGTPIPSPVSGEVLQSWFSPYKPSGGNEVQIFADGFTHILMHMLNGSRKVKKGDHVKAGQIVGKVGNTGNSFGDHLHWQVNKGRGYLRNEDSIDPELWAKKYAKGGSAKGGWATKIRQAASRMGVKVNGSDVDDILSLINKESGGDERIVQHGYVDENTGGNEARGLLQYTPRTFSGYKVSGSGNILSGFDQLLAFFNNSNWRRDLSSWQRRIANGSTGWGPSGLRRFANGGMIKKHEIVEAGEGNKPEMIIPLTRKARAMQLIEQAKRFMGVKEQDELDLDMNTSSGMGARLLQMIITQQQQIVALQEQQTNLLIAIAESNDVIANKDTEINFNSFERQVNKIVEKKEYKTKRINKYRN